MECPWQGQAERDWRRHPGLPFDLAPDKREDALKNGRHFYRLDVSIQEEIISKNKKIGDFLKNIESLGEVVHLNPSLDEMNRLSEADLRGTVLELYTISILGPDVASVGFDLGAEAIHEISLKEGSPGLPPALEEKPKKQAKGKDTGKTTKQTPPAQPAGGGESASANAKKSTIDETVRVKTRVLNSLMDMAGEMVLGRNRLVRVLDGHLDEIDGVGPVLHQVSSITTQIQNLSCAPACNRSADYSEIPPRDS